jgi:hypothetical protein
MISNGGYDPELPAVITPVRLIFSIVVSAMAPVDTKARPVNAKTPAVSNAEPLVQYLLFIAVASDVKCLPGIGLLGCHL